MCVCVCVYVCVHVTSMYQLVVVTSGLIGKRLGTLTSQDYITCTTCSHVVTLITKHILTTISVQLTSYQYMYMYIDTNSSALHTT